MEAVAGKGQRKVGRDFDIIRGQHQQLVGKIQERYGVAKDVATKQADEFLASLNADAAAESDEDDTAEIARPQKVGGR